MTEIAKMVLIEGQGRFKLMGKSIVSAISTLGSDPTAQRHLFHVLNVKDVRAGMHLGYLGQRYKIVGVGIASKILGVEIVTELVG